MFDIRGLGGKCGRFMVGEFARPVAIDLPGRARKSLVTWTLPSKSVGGHGTIGAASVPHSRMRGGGFGQWMLRYGGIFRLRAGALRHFSHDWRKKIVARCPRARAKHGCCCTRILLSAPNTPLYWRRRTVPHGSTRITADEVTCENEGRGSLREQRPCESYCLASPNAILTTKSTIIWRMER